MKNFWKITTLLPWCLTVIILSYPIAILEGTLWSTPVNLSLSGTNAVCPKIAVDFEGNAVAIWSRYDGNHYVIQSSKLKMGQNWSTPTVLSQVGQNAFFSNVSTNLAGDTIAAWSRFDGTNYIIQVVQKNFGGQWTNPVNLSLSNTLSNEDSILPQIGYDANGNATVIWQKNNNNHYTIQAATKKMCCPWSAPITLTTIEPSGIGCTNPQIAIDPFRASLAVWINQSHSTIQFAEKQLNLNWTAPINLSSPGNGLSSPQIKTDFFGNITVVWSESDGSNQIIYSTHREGIGAWSSPLALSLPGGDALAPQLAIDVQGNAVAVWQRSNGQNTIIECSTKKLGSAWSTPVALSLLGQDASQPQVAISRNYTISAIWKRSDGTNFIIEMTNKTVNGSWSTPIELSQSGQDANDPQLAIDLLGNVYTIWQRSNGATSIIQSSIQGGL